MIRIKARDVTLPAWHHGSAMLISEAYTDLAVAVKIRWRIKVLIAVKTFRLQVHKSKIQFCPACGSPTKLAVPDGDEKMRAICSSCGRVHYENPKMVCAEQINEKGTDAYAFGLYI